MTELSKDNDQESSYKEAFRSDKTLSQSKNKSVCKLSDDSHYTLTLKARSPKLRLKLKGRISQISSKYDKKTFR